MEHGKQLQSNAGTDNRCFVSSVPTARDTAPTRRIAPFPQFALGLFRDTRGKNLDHREDRSFSPRELFQNVESQRVRSATPCGPFDLECKITVLYEHRSCVQDLPSLYESAENVCATSLNIVQPTSLRSADLQQQTISIDIHNQNVNSVCKNPKRCSRQELHQRELMMTMAMVSSVLCACCLRCSSVSVWVVSTFLACAEGLDPKPVATRICMRP